LSIANVMQEWADLIDALIVVAYMPPFQPAKPLKEQTGFDKSNND
jgi:hypothetical protein